MSHFNLHLMRPFLSFQFFASLPFLVFVNLFSINAEAFESKGVATIGWDLLGGDLLATDTGGSCGNPDVQANNGVVISAGGILVNGSFETQATVGYKYASPVGEEGAIVWDAVPLELLQFYRKGNMRMGLGVAYHINSKLIVDVPGSSFSKYYNNALGGIVQLGWAPFEKSYSIDLRYTVIQYQEKDAVNVPNKSGDVLGIHAGYYF